MKGDLKPARAYPINAANYDNCLYPGPCVLDAIFTTALGTTTYVWNLFDGLTAGGTVIAMGGIATVAQSSMGLRIHDGIYFQGLLGATQSGWCFLIMAAPDGF